MANVKFYRGLASKYNATTHANGIYFATDTHVIKLDGVDYGLSTDQATALGNSVKQVVFTSPNTLTIKYTDTTKEDSVITLVKYVGSNAIAVAAPNASMESAVSLTLNSNDKVLTQDSNGLLANISLTYDSNNKLIKLLGKDVTVDETTAPTVISSIDATDFIKDGMIDSVELVTNPTGKPEGTYIKITFNTAAGKDPIYLDVTSLIDVYTAGNGLQLSSGEFSIKIDSTSESGLTVSANGLKLTGLDAKANKLAMSGTGAATENNILVVSSTGDLKDSGHALSEYKTQQTAVSDPTASGTTAAFIDSISQNANGEITVTKKSVQGAVAYVDAQNPGQAGLMSANDKATLDSISSDFNSKADKVSGATTGNFAGLDNEGNLTDSGSKASDFKTVQTAVADSDATTSGEDVTFVDSVTQNTNGEITVHKKTVKTVAKSTSGVGGNNGLMTAAQAEKLDGIATGAQVNVLEGVQVNGTDLAISNKKVNVTVAEGTTNGTVAVNGSDVAVHGLGSAAYEDTTAFEAAGSIATAIAALDATESQTAGADGLALSVTEVDGVITAISGSIAANTYDAHGAASTAKSEVIGASTDASTANTVYGAKKYADEAVAAGLVWNEVS